MWNRFPSLFKSSSFAKVNSFGHKTSQKSFKQNLRPFSSFFSTLIINSENFEELVEKSQKPLVLDCHAKWCGPCQVLGPILERIVAKKKGAVTMATLDVDENPEIAFDKLNIRSVPSVFGYQNGKIVDQFVGCIPDDEIETFVNGLVEPKTPKEA